MAVRQAIMSLPVLSGLLLAPLFAFVAWFYNGKLHRKNYFPSPPSGPILGHLRIFPQDAPWVTFAEWGKLYGDAMHLSLAGRPLVILNKAEDAHNLLDKRSSNFSDRPRAVLQGEIAGMQHFMGFERYGDDFRTSRRHFNQVFGSRQHMSLHPLLSEQVRILLGNLLNKPNEFEHHLDRTIASIIVKSTYGHDIMSGDDDYINLATNVFVSVFTLGVTGLIPFDLIPALRFIPSWFPGAGLLTKAKTVRKMVDRMVNEPFERVKAQRKSGIEEYSLVDVLLDNYEANGIQDEKQEMLIKCTAAVIYGAGVETSTDTLLSFLILMVHHPEVMRKGQAEIDKVIESGQLPRLENRPDLPYVDCILKEVMRMHPAAPLGLLHASISEDVYKDKVIPAGSLIAANIWAMMRDEYYFPDPEKFNPDRFLPRITLPENANVHPLNTYKPDDPSSLVFGFGRRICPGRFFADSSTWLAIASILSVFDILPPVDSATGKEFIPKMECYGGLLPRLKPFNCRIVPRSEKHASLILNQ